MATAAAPMRLRSGALVSHPPPAPKRHHAQISTDEVRPERVPLTAPNLHRYIRALTPTQIARAEARARLHEGMLMGGPLPTITASDLGFGCTLLEHGIMFAPETARPARDHFNVKHDLDCRRASPEPDTDDWANFIVAVWKAEDEATFRETAWPHLAKTNISNDHYFADHGAHWLHADYVAPLARGLPRLCPDITEAFRISSYPDWAANALDGDLRPGSGSGAMPVLAVEAKKHMPFNVNTEHQCAHIGAVMTRAALRAQRLAGVDQARFFNWAQALTVTFNGDYMKIYAHHAVVNTTGDTEYHCVPLWADELHLSLAGFRAAYRHVRNAQDWCRSRARQTLMELHFTAYSDGPRPILPPVLRNA